MSSAKIGEFIYKCRKEKRMTQEELGEKLGVTGKSISRWENSVTMPDISMINDIAKELGVEPSELLNGEKMDNSELKELHSAVDRVIKYSDYEEKAILKKISRFLIIKIVCISCVMLNNFFNIIGILFDDNISRVVNNIVLTFVLVFVIIDFYDNRHAYDFKAKNLIFSNSDNKK